MRFVVTGITGRQPMYTVHRFEVEARNKTEAKRRIRQSTRGYVNGEPIRDLAADPIVRPCCENCGSTDLMFDGVYGDKCRDCGHWRKERPCPSVESSPLSKEDR